MNNFKQIFPKPINEAVATSVDLPLSDPIDTLRYVSSVSEKGLRVRDTSPLGRSPVSEQTFEDYDNTFIVSVATTGPLTNTPVYSNGVLGIGRSLTASLNGAIGTIDGRVLVVGDTVLVKDQTNRIHNGIYEVTDIGSAGTPYVLVGYAPSDESLELNRSIVSILYGTVNENKSFVQVTPTPVVGTDNIIYQQQNVTNTVTDIKLSFVLNQRSKTQAFGGMRQAVAFDNFLFASGLGAANIIKMDYNGDAVWSVNVAGVKTGSLAVSYQKRRVYFPTNDNIHIHNADTGASIAIIPYGSTIGITGIAVSGDIIMVAAIGASQVRIYRESTGAFLGVVASPAGTFFATQDGRYAYFGGQGVAKISMNENFTSYTLAHAGFSQTPVVVQDKIYLTYTSGNSHLMVPKNNATFVQFTNAPAAPRGVGSNGYMVGYGNFSANSWTLYDYRTGQLIASGPGTGNPHCIGFIRNRMFVLDGNTGNIVIVENTGSTFVVPTTGTRLYRDVDYEIMRAVSSTGVIKEMTVPA